MIEIVFETHATTEDNERGIASGWRPGRLSGRGVTEARELGRRRGTGARVLVVGHLATRWALDHHLRGAALVDLATQQSTWQEGWEYQLA